MITPVRSMKIVITLKVVVISHRSKNGRKSTFFSYPPVKTDVSGPIELPGEVPHLGSRVTATCGQKIGLKGNSFIRQEMPVSDNCPTKNVESKSDMEPISATKIKNAYSLLLAPKNQAIVKSKTSAKNKADRKGSQPNPPKKFGKKPNSSKSVMPAPSMQKQKLLAEFFVAMDPVANRKPGLDGGAV